jgi:NAD-dependent DNA ligase
MHSDHQPYIRFTSRSRLEQSIHSLLGLLKGISVDLNINERELYFLSNWLSEHGDMERLHPFNEIVPILREALEDGEVSEEERDDLIWVYERLCSNKFYDEITTGIQQLHGLLGGVVADGIISEDELRGVQSWMEENKQLKKRWPYDEIESLVASVLADGSVDEVEHKMLMSFFAQFAQMLDDKTLSNPYILTDSTLKGVCANSPEIIFQGSRFCLTGASSRYARNVFAEKITALGGSVVGSVSQKLNYLIIGGDGNPCWSYACYGRKVEKALELRKAGAEIVIAHEFDLHKAVGDER